MKAIKLIAIGIVMLLGISVHAQVSVNVSIGLPPLWGPVGYTEVRYYYLPDVEAYYDVQSTMFIYYDRGAWIHRAYLPSRYSNYDLYGGYKVVMKNYYGNAPYTYFNSHKKQYAKGYSDKSQKTIGGRPEKGKSQNQKHYKDHSNKKSNQGNNKFKDHGKNDGKGKKQ